MSSLQIWLAALALLALFGVGIGLFRYGIDRITGAIAGVLGGIPSRRDVRQRTPGARDVKRRVIGRPERFKRRALTAVLLLSVATVVVGIWYAARTGLGGVSSSSLPLLRPVLKIVTSTWVLPIVIAIVGRNIILYRRELEARQAADVTGYSEQTVKWLGEEVKHPDAETRTRVLATNEDEIERIEDRILEALNGGEDDTLSSYRAEYRELQDDEAVDVVEGDDSIVALSQELDDLDARIHDLDAEIESELDQVTSAEFDPDALVDVLEGDEDRVAPVDLMSADDRARLDDVDRKLETLDDLLEERDELAAVLEERLEDELEDVAPAFQEDDVDEENNGALSESSSGVEDEENWQEQYKLFKLDLFTALDAEALAWRVGLPAGLTIAGLMIVVQFWVKPWFYPPIIAFGVLVGVLNYLRVERSRSKRLEDLRAESAGVRWDDLAIHVQEVEVPETRIQIARMAGESYAHDDREEFAEEVAIRAYERVNGVDPSPSIMTKQADQLANYRPDLHGFRDAERERIAVWLIDRVGRSATGLIPKAKLIEEAIEQPAPHSWIPFQRSRAGYDPELVREAYREFVPAALVEQEIAIDGEDGPLTVTAVRLRSDPIPAEYGEIQAQFSNQFSNYAEREPLYELPDVTDRLEGAPVYADQIGALTGAD